MKKYPLAILFCLAALLFSACSSTKPLTGNQKMLVRNNVYVVDEKDPDFSKLKSYCRPLPNKKFMDIFNLKTMCYSAGQPTFDKNGELKDSKFRQWMRNKVGEAPVLLDSTEIEGSISQLNTVMSQLGYFDSKVNFDVVENKANHKKVKVNYNIEAQKPYSISAINYDINVPEYKKIIIVHKNESLLHEGMQYNESLITDELTRIINLIRNDGYYNVEKSIFHCEVSYDPADSNGISPNTVSLDIILDMPNDASASRYLYKYQFNKIYIQTNFDANADANLQYDTVRYCPNTKRDSTDYYFITPHTDYGEIIKDFKYKTIADAIFTTTGETYSQMAKQRSSRAITQLDNFSYYSINYKENFDLLDTNRKVGYLDVLYRLTRKKVHGIGGQIDLRNDRSAISFSYSNRNLFHGAEHFTLNLSGGYFYYSLSNLFSKEKTNAYPEFGVSASLEFPNLFLFNNVRNREAIKYNTTINVGVNYSGLYKRLMYNLNLTYNWSPNYYINHSVSPIDLSTINNSNKRYTRIIDYEDYPDSYQQKFGKFFLLSFKYSFNYLVPFHNTTMDNMRFSLNFESSGLLLKGLNALFSPDERWIFGRNGLDSTGYNYTTFEKLEFTWNYTHKFNDNNAFATRINAGAIIPLDKGSHIPYEKGFYMGTSNSMRGWGYRGLGPGSYEHKSDSLFTGDIKIEWNLEYRGTIYRSFKYGIFSDLGNIWLARRNEDMPGAEFAFNRFFKEFAWDLGIGLRLDFDFFVIRIDYAFPIYDPSRSSEGCWINSQWIKGAHPLRWGNGLKIAIGYAF